MSQAKEIRTKIKSVKNTQKITKAMEMVAASKMRRAQDRMRKARPYGEKIREVCAQLAQANAQYAPALLAKREDAKNGGLILITSDKGLCGGLNANVLRLALSQVREWEDAGGNGVATVIGNKGVGFWGRLKSPLISEYVGFGDQPSFPDLIGAIKVMIDAFRNGEVDVVRLLFTRFINTVKQEPVCEQLLPIPAAALLAENRQYAWDYLYEPAPEPVVDLLLTRYVEAVIYQALAENIASEQAARMVAMKAASDNAGNLIDELQLVYNKSRQAAITQEISEIVGGAAAV